MVPRLRNSHGLGLMLAAKLHNCYLAAPAPSRRRWCTLWAGIVDEQLIGPVKVPAGVKINSAAYCELLSEGLFPWLKDQSLSLRKNIMLMQDNVPSHSAKATQQYLASKFAIFKSN